MVRLVRAARRTLRRMAAASAARRPAATEPTDRIDIELTAREELRSRPVATLGGACRRSAF